MYFLKHKNKLFPNLVLYRLAQEIGNQELENEIKETYLINKLNL